MPQAQLFRLEAEVRCADGDCGKLMTLVVNRATDAVTHLVVEPARREAPARIVPLSLVDIGGADTAQGEVRLRCTRAEFEQLDPAEETLFPGDEGYEAYGDMLGTGGRVALLRHHGPPAAGSAGHPGAPGTIPEPVTVDTVPDQLPDEDEVFRGDHVHATDGDIGHVLGFVVEAGSGRVTSILLREGHLLGRRTVLVPRSAVAEVGADGFRLNITREQVRHLPPADIEHPSAGLQAAGDLRQRGQRAVVGDEVGQAAAIAPFEQVGTDLFRAADEDRRHLPHRLGVDPCPAAPRDQVLGRGQPPARDDERAERADLQVPEPVAGRLPQHADLRVERRRQPVPGIVAVGRVPDRRRQDAGDVRVPGGEPQHARAARANQQPRRTGPGHREDVEIQPVDLVELARVPDRRPGQQALDDGERFVQPGDAPARRVEGDARRGVLGLVPAGPMPSSNRPPDSRCRLAASCATMAGCRKSFDSTRVPTRSRVVTAAAAARALNGASCCPNAPAEKWSRSSSVPIPLSSTRRAKSSHSRPSATDSRTTPNRNVPMPRTLPR